MGGTFQESYARVMVVSFACGSLFGVEVDVF